MNWTICLECGGTGSKRRTFKKQVELELQKEVEEYEKLKREGKNPIKPNQHLYACTDCSASGLIQSSSPVKPNNTDYQHLAIIGGGIAGIALGIACLHRGIPFTIFERDKNFNVRSQGYGLTLQQASKAIKGLGIQHLQEGLSSNRHVVHNTEGKVIGEWGLRKRAHLDNLKTPKRTNIHIARQSLRSALIEQLGGADKIQWNHQLINIRQREKNRVELTFQVDDVSQTIHTDIVVGADGIRSAVRKLLIPEDQSPLRYLGCIVILGICPLSNLKDKTSPLLDSATVFQTANGHDRIYVMPFTKDVVMWQLSFPIAQEEAKKLSNLGPEALKAEACRRTQWHTPIPEIVSSTEASLITGYPAYDREMFNLQLLEDQENATLIGDAAHPMSPFKGQGANQALLDALSLARLITKACKSSPNWKELGIRKSILSEFELEMHERCISKVEGSAEAVYNLHSEHVLQERDAPRGHVAKTQITK